MWISESIDLMDHIDYLDNDTWHHPELLVEVIGLIWWSLSVQDHTLLAEPYYIQKNTQVPI